VPGDFNGDAVPDFSVQFGIPSSPDLTTLGFSGVDGSLLWTTMPFAAGGATQSPGISVGQFGSGPPDDVYFQGGATFVLSGATGGQIATGGPAVSYFLPILYDTTGNGQDEVLFTAGQSPVTLYSSDLQTALWTSSDSDSPYPYGAIAVCPGTPNTSVLVEGSWKNPARLKTTQLTGSALGTLSTVVLAGGSLYPNETAAKAAGAFLGQLTAANVHSNLTGLGHPSAVVGSSDGWLYAVNPCTGLLDFAVQVGAEVGEAVFGDTDGDGQDEVLVTAADGYLYDYKGFSIAAPTYVLDTDPPTVTNQEVSSLVTTNRLSATWGSVSGATSYAVQVVTAVGSQLVSTPAWQNVGNVTAISLTGLPLKDDTKYLFGVRAIGPNGPSVDALSSGVVVHFPDAGADASTEGGTEAGADAGNEAGLDGGLDGSMESGPQEAGSDGGEPGGGGGGGCGCRVVESTQDVSPFFLIGLSLPVAFFARRRRHIKVLGQSAGS
jgi:hypothetical protein